MGLDTGLCPGWGGWGGWGPGWADSWLSGGPCRATLVCAWAEEGADALGPDEQLLHSDAFPPPRVVDTLGAGDTFNASVIFSLAQGEYPGRRPRAEACLCPEDQAHVAICPSREDYAGGPEIWLPGGRQEVWPAGL